MAPHNWSRAYARQALSDLQARDVLANSQVDRCHRLHFLQMAAEKTCKAHLSFEDGNRDVKRSHAYVRQVLPIIARNSYSEFHGGAALPAWQLSDIRRLASEIEVLAPACDAGDVRYDNSEYPWLDARGLVQIPCDYKFSRIDDEGRTFVLVIKLLRAAANMYAR